MSRVVLVRHGQASFLEPNYDTLCATGELQARRLGEYWARREVVFKRAWSGPCVRQVQTARIVAEAFCRIGREFPDPEVMNEFDEYPGEIVLRRGLPRLLDEFEELAHLHSRFERATDPDERRRWFQRVFEFVIGRWVNGELIVAGIETWDDFCARVGRGLAEITRGNTSGEDQVVFTSGGPIGVAMQRALNLSPAETLQLSWMSRNGSFSEFLSSGDRFTLSAFNAHPHLDEDALLTYR